MCIMGNFERKEGPPVSGALVGCQILENEVRGQEVNLVTTGLNTPQTTAYSIIEGQELFIP